LKYSENRWSTASVSAGLPSTSLIAGNFKAVSVLMRSDGQAPTFREMAKGTGTTIRSSFKIWTEQKILLAAGICRINPTNYYGKKRKTDPTEHLHIYFATI
jgi:hypothetical protein